MITGANVMDMSEEEYFNDTVLFQICVCTCVLQSPDSTYLITHYHEEDVA